MQTLALDIHTPVSETPFSGKASTASAVRRRGVVWVNAMFGSNVGALAGRRVR